jgi:hypothetical protein
LTNSKFNFSSTHKRIADVMHGFPPRIICAMRRTAGLGCNRMNTTSRMKYSLSQIESGILRLKWLAAATRFEIALWNHYWALKAGYRADQRRVPAGSGRESGRWTSEGGNSNSDARVILASDQLPEVPKERPPTAQERTRIAREVARRLSRVPGLLGKILQGASWLYEFRPYIQSYFDPPKSLEELQQSVSDPQRGYDIHHIVEQTSAEQDGFPRRMIDAPEYLVRIPTLKHWEINAWYQTKNDEFGGLSPRDYLRGESWVERIRVGHSALVKFGVLKP